MHGCRSGHAVRCKINLSGDAAFEAAYDAAAVEPVAVGASGTGRDRREGDAMKATAALPSRVRALLSSARRREPWRDCPSKY
jgi:hypothetical protein